MDHDHFDHDFDDSFDDDDIADEDMLMVLDKLESAPILPAPSAHPEHSNPLPNPPDHGNRDQSLYQNPSLTGNRSLAQISPEWPNQSAVSASSFSSSNSGKGQGPGLVRTGSLATTLRQTTLWGTTLPDDQPSQPTTGRAFRSDLPSEKPTPHELDPDALRTWVYPTNLGAIRDYQYSIVQKGLFHNTLVALPTGLGKTFIAATVMLNFYRWTKSAQIVFVAPTKPLVAQQIEACFNIVGIPKSDTAILTGSTSRDLRAVKWKRHRVFFMTPQTLMRDLASGIADPKKIVLLVVDEAHRATGEYAYAQVSRFIRRFSSSFRVLALTATPGAKIETVQEVIDNLGISQVEIRTEESLDIRQYVHQLSVDQHVLDHSAEILQVRLLLTKALKPMVDRLMEQNIYYARDPMNFTTYGLMQAQKEWFASQSRGMNPGLKHMIRAVFSVLTGLAHSIKLLNFHGIRPFYDNMVQLRSETEAKRGKGSKYKTQLVADPSFVEMMDAILVWLNTDPAGYLGHPKIPLMTDTILAHFMGHGDDSATKVIVFSEFRDSAEEIVRVLGHHKPTIRPAVFVGQADSKRSGGMKQSQQLEAIRKFKAGEYNVLVATSIGEEGLDIGQVDLIVCYDASSSPIRMLQRAGRTGRKRAGRIVLLLMRGKEEDAYRRSRENYDVMQKLICDGSQFNFRSDLSTRIVPRDIRPVVDRRPIEIPVENTQDPALMKPKKEGRVAAATRKKPVKKFHMPDGVNPNFVKASELSIDGCFPPPQPAAATVRTPRLRPETDHLTELPPLDKVVLSRQDEAKLKCRFAVPSLRDDADGKVSSAPSLGAHPAFQRTLGAWARFGHSERTVRCVRLFQTMAELQSAGAIADILDRSIDHSRYHDIPANDFAPDSEDEKDSSKKRGRQGAVAADGAEKEERFPKRPRLTSTAGASKQGRGKKSPAGLASDTEDDSRPADQPLPVAKAALVRKKPRTKGGGGGRRRGAGGINSDEMGDDCSMDGNGVETDGSDDGADLADFIVSDDGELSTMDELAGSTPPPGTAASSGPGDSPEPRVHGFDGGLSSMPGSAGMSDPILPAAVTARQRNRVAVLDSDEEW